MSVKPGYTSTRNGWSDHPNRWGSQRKGKRMKKDNFYAAVPKKKSKVSDEFTISPKHRPGRKVGKMAVCGVIAAIGALLLTKIPKRY